MRLKIENLISARKNHVPIDPETAAWLAGAKGKLLAKLAEYDLIDAPQTTAAEPDRPLDLGTFLQQYFTLRGDVKGSTQTNWRHTERNLWDFFGGDKVLSTITVGEAKDFERFLKTTAREMRYGDAEKSEGLKPATLAKRISNAKQFFQDAAERGLIPLNPFAKLKCSQKANRSRDFFVTLDMAEQVLQACPDAQWRLLFALSRFGGLRCPSEHVLLTWQDVDWARGRLTIHSPKTEHHEGKATRVIPLFPELRKYLEQVWDQVEGQLAIDAQDRGVPVASAFIITRYRNPNQNLRTQLEKIIRRAGFEPWPKLWQNLRSSCETELMAQFPAHVVVAWIGHTERIAQKHYLQVTDADFERASGGALHQRSSQAPHSAEKRDCGALETAQNRVISQNPAIQVGGAGLEPVTSAV